jgi:hypothetical protein
MTPKQHYLISEAIKCIQSARKWLDQAMYYSGEEMPENELKKVRQAYDEICRANDLL